MRWRGLTLICVLGGIFIRPAHANTAANLASLMRNSATAAEKCNAAEDEDIKKARTKAATFKTQQDGEKAADPLAACRQMEDVSSTGSSAITKFRGRCQPEVTKCKQDIENLGSAALDATHKKAKEACEKAEKELAKTESEIKKNNSQAKASAKCQQDIAGGGGEMPQMPQMPEKEPTPTPTPTDPPQDCTNPKFAAGNLVCRCMVNPMHEECTGKPPSIEDLVNDNSQATDNSVPQGPGPGSSFAPSARQKSSLGQFKGGGGAGGGGGGMSASSPAGAGGSEGQKPGAALPVIKIGGGGGGSAGSASESSGKASAAGGAGYSEGARNDSPDLKKFLPQRRGPATGIGPDGITGPHTDIFKKINIRYQAQRANLKS